MVRKASKSVKIRARRKKRKRRPKTTPNLMKRSQSKRNPKNDFLIPTT
jgi:hypothetical protein